MTYLNETEQLKQLAETVLKKVKNKGATHCEVDVEFSDGFNVSARNGEVETVEYERDKEVDITIYCDHRIASVSSTDTSEQAIDQIIDKAFHMVKYVVDDPCMGLADARLMATSQPDLLLYHPWHIDPKAAIDIAIACERYALDYDPRITQAEGASVSTYKGVGVYGNSHGFIGVTESTRHDLSCSLIAKQNGLMERDYDYTVSRDPANLMSAEFVAKRAAEKTVNRLGARKIKTCQSPVIFSSECARGLLGLFISAISGGNLYRKSSFLVDALGSQVFSDHMHIYEDPFVLKALGSTAFDSDGVATNKKDFIKDGVLQSYSLGDYSAKRLGLKTTGNADGVHNLMVNHGDKSLLELIKTMDKGLVVTDLMGQGINLVTGDYSRGAFGYWVEKGEIKHPVHEITIAGRLQDMFQHIIEIGNDVDSRGNVHTGSILIEQMMIAGD